MGWVTTPVTHHVCTSRCMCDEWLTYILVDNVVVDLRILGEDLQQGSR